jgi:predicted deacylase
MRFGIFKGLLVLGLAVGLSVGTAQAMAAYTGNITQGTEPTAYATTMAQGSPPMTTAYTSTIAQGNTSTGTVYTGDIIQGTPVISALNIDDLEPGKKHSFYFQGAQMASGQYWYVPVVVAKGARSGKRILLTSGVHGDELSSIDVVQRTMAQLDPAQMSGTVTAVYDISRPALEAISRFWPVTERGGFKIDANRIWPGDEAGFNAPERHAGLVFNRLLKPNADYALDNHTGTSGFSLTGSNFANLKQPEIRAMNELFPIEQIWDNPGYAGTLENALNAAGIPALTTEVGDARAFDRRIIPMFLEGTMNVLKLHGVIPGPMGPTTKEAGTFFGNALHTVHAIHGGYLELKVDLRSKVVPGQVIALQRNSFGEVVREYKTEVGGEVMGLQHDALIEPGGKIAVILYQDSACAADGCAADEADYTE